MSNENDTSKKETQIAKPATQDLIAVDDSEFSSLLDTAQFNQMWKVATLFSQTQLVPKQYQGKPSECFVASQMAVRLGVDPMMFMQNTYVVHGTPGMEAKLAIALINKKGPFTGPIQWKFEGEGDARKCTAFGELPNGNKCESTITMKMVKAEGWIKNSKWTSMPDQMFMYRSASFLGRLYCPEVLMGMQTLDEIVDVGDNRNVPFVDAQKSNTVKIKTESGNEIIDVDVMPEEEKQDGEDREWRNG